MLSSLSTALLLLSSLSYTWAYPNPGTVTGYTAVADPTMCKDSAGTYFVYSTAPGIQIITSTDRTAWTLEGTVWEDGDDTWTDTYTGTTNGNIWAPCCRIEDGTFYLYYAASSFGSQDSAIYFAKSTTGLPGSFTNEGLVLSSSSSVDYNAIDPALLIDGSNWYLSFGSFWTGIKGVPLASDTGKPSTSTITSLAEQSSPDAMEASVIYQYGDYFYLFTSWGNCCDGTSSTYTIHVGRSSSYDGTYVDENGTDLMDGGGTLILEAHGSIYGPGGQDIMTDGDEVVIVYHYYTSTGTWLGINLLDFSTGWPVVY